MHAKSTISNVPVVESACFHISSPPRTSSTSFRFNFVLEVICMTDEQNYQLLYLEKEETGLF